MQKIEILLSRIFKYIIFLDVLYTSKYIIYVQKYIICPKNIGKDKYCRIRNDKIHKRKCLFLIQGSFIKTSQVK